MLLGYQSIAEFIAFVITGLFAFAYHEFAHAIVADRLGDPTPREHGRITPNPIVHLDALGFILLIIFRFGWAVTPVNPYRMRGNPRTSMAIVAVAGPVANLLMALLYALPIRIGLIDQSTSGTILPSPYDFLMIGVWINLILFAFNLLPIPPLDGFTILLGLLPPDLAYRLEPLRKYGSLLIFGLIALSFVGLNIFGIIIFPITNTLLSLLTGV